MRAELWVIGLHAVITDQTDLNRLKQRLARVAVLELKHARVMIPRFQQSRDAKQTGLLHTVNMRVVYKITSPSGKA